MTGAITGNDIAKFDDAVSCGFPARMGAGTPSEERERQRQEEQMIRELNEESDAMRDAAFLQDGQLRHFGYQMELEEEASVWETSPGPSSGGGEGRPGT
jgi:hypothetical protein